MSKSRMVWEAQKRDAEGEIAFERGVRFGRFNDRDVPGYAEEMRAALLDSRVDLAGMAAVFLGEES